MTENVKTSLWGVALLDESQQNPFDFMREQGEELREETGGRLWGEVKFFVGKDGINYHEFQIASERLNDYRCLLLRTAHAKLIFPLYIYDFSQSDDGLKSYEYKYVTRSIRDEMMAPQKILGILDRPREVKVAVESERGNYFAPPPDFIANNFKEFEKIFAEILQSKGTRAIVHSLLIQSNGTPIEVS